MYTVKDETRELSALIARRNQISVERGKLDRRYWELDREDDKLRERISEMRQAQAQGTK